MVSLIVWCPLSIFVVTSATISSFFCSVNAISLASYTLIVSCIFSMLTLISLSKLEIQSGKLLNLPLLLLNFYSNLGSPFGAGLSLFD